MEADLEKWLTRSEVAQLFRVSTTTVSKWALEGKIPSVKTPGGWRRYRESDVLALLANPQAHI